MNYTNIKAAKFLKRPNRFVAQVLIDNQVETVHVKNTGRCREILTEGTQLILEASDNVKRKTKYSVIAAYKGEMLINIDSQVPNAVVYEGILDGKIKELPLVHSLKREVFYGNSRFDLYFEAEGKKGFLEVKGVTLEQDGVALFPDAPTERGTKHIKEMIKAVEEGYEGYIFFLIQMKPVTYFTPFVIRDPKFAEALLLAQKRGVKVLAYDCIVKEDGIFLDAPVEVLLSPPLEQEAK